MDVTTTEGKIQMLKNWEEQDEETPPEAYVAVLEDIAIYGPKVKMIYARGAFFPLVMQRRAFLFPLWHVAKMLVQATWKRFMFTIVGPAYKACFQGSAETCILKCSLTAKLIFFTDLTIAYEKCRPAFQQVYNDPQYADHDVVEHVKQFFEFFVLLVSYEFSYFHVH